MKSTLAIAIAVLAFAGSPVAFATVSGGSSSGGVSSSGGGHAGGGGGYSGHGGGGFSPGGHGGFSAGGHGGFAGGSHDGFSANSHGGSATTGHGGSDAHAAGSGGMHGFLSHDSGPHGAASRAVAFHSAQQAARITARDKAVVESRGPHPIRPHPRPPHLPGRLAPEATVPAVQAGSLPEHEPRLATCRTVYGNLWGPCGYSQPTKAPVDPKTGMPIG